MMTKYYLAPQNWQDFETLTYEICRTRVPGGGVQLNGRAGQPQAGVDVFYTEPGTSGLVGVQCKKKDATPTEPASTLSIDEVEAEVMKAEHFRPALCRFILATTANRDRWLQERVNCLSKQRVDAGRFAVETWSWGDFVSALNMYATVREWYDPILQATHGEKRLDREVLELLHMAFSRAAFRTQMSSEVPDELKRALQDTQRALDTGVLVDRETGITIKTAPAGILALRNDAAGKGRRIINEVHKARELLDKAIQDRRIVHEGNCLCVNDHKVAHEIDRHRDIAIRSLNELLESYGMAAVEASLPL